MIYPENFERKIGFNEIRTLLKGRCLSSLGTEWVDKELHFMHDFEQIKQALDEAREYKIFEEQTDEEVETEFFDVREALLRARPERTFLEELDLFNLKRSIASVLSYAKLFTQKVDDEDLSTTDADTENNREQIKYLYPALGKMACDVAVFPDIIQRIDKILYSIARIALIASSN